MKKTTMTMIAATIVLTAGTALAGLEADLKCQASKNKITGQYYACRQKAAATAVAKGGAPDYAKCVSKFTEKWNAAESSAGSACLDNFPAPGQVDALIADQSTTVAGIVGGTGSIPACGDGVINAAGEHCDGAAMDSQTCASFGLFGTLGCTSECTVDLSACTTCPGTSVPYAGSCWVLGAQGSNCTTACATVGLTYDTATSTVAGSSGTDANCLALLYAFDTPGGELDNAGGDCVTAGFGCSVLPAFGFRARCGTPVTDAASSHPDARRVCACQ